MLEKSFSILYYLKHTKNQKDENRYIYLRITVNGNRREISIKRRWIPDQWNAHLGRTNGISEKAKELNAYLDLITFKVYQAKTKLMESNKPLTAVNVKDVLIGNDEKKHFIIDAFEHHNKQIKRLVGREVAPATLTRYRTACDHVQNFIRWKYKKEDLEIRYLDYEFISQFLFWLKTERLCANNTAVKYVGNFKKIVMECKQKGLLTNDPFLGFKTRRVEVMPIVLTKTDLIKIENKQFETERLNHVRDIFLFSCYTGLAYSDVYKLRASNIVIGVDDSKWINTTRQKTKSSTRLPLLPNALAILDKYRAHPKCLTNGTLLPVLTNQKMNAYLKEIADLAGLNKNLTFHTARHTFATTVTLTNGVPIETVSKMLGHSSLKHTQHYAKVLDVKISHDMKLLKRKLTRA